MLENIHDLGRGRWKSILTGAGVPPAHLTGRHGPCPMCGGKDRFRFTNHEDTGAYICNQCGAGSAIDLLMALRNVDFRGAAEIVRDQLPGSRIEAPAAKPRTNDAKADWARGHRLSGHDAVCAYLAGRGLEPNPWPSQLRFVARARHWDAAKIETVHCAMLANFVAPDGSSSLVHMTWITESGEKAPVTPVRKFRPGIVPRGGAVRLSASAPVMGVAEGIETALAAAQLHDVPVWATLTAGGLINWQPPTTASRIVVFGDNDASLTGQAAAWSLAHRLRGKGLAVEVRIPELPGYDWNDVLAHEREGPR